MNYTKLAESYPRGLCDLLACATQIFQSTLVLFDPKKIEVFFSKKLEVFSLKK